MGTYMLPKLEDSEVPQGLFHLYSGPLELSLNVSMISAMHLRVCYIYPDFELFCSGQFLGNDILHAAGSEVFSK